MKLRGHQFVLSREAIPPYWGETRVPREQSHPRRKKKKRVEPHDAVGWYIPMGGANRRTTKGKEALGGGNVPSHAGPFSTKLCFGKEYLYIRS